MMPPVGSLVAERRVPAPLPLWWWWEIQSGSVRRTTVASAGYQEWWALNAPRQSHHFSLFFFPRAPVEQLWTINYPIKHVNLQKKNKQTLYLVFCSQLSLSICLERDRNEAVLRLGLLHRGLDTKMVHDFQIYIMWRTVSSTGTAAISASNRRKQWLRSENQKALWSDGATFLPFALSYLSWFVFFFPVPAPVSCILTSLALQVMFTEVTLLKNHYLVFGAPRGLCWHSCPGSTCWHLCFCPAPPPHPKPPPDEL